MLQQQQIQLVPMVKCGAIYFAPQSMLAVNCSGYLPGDDERIITVHTAGPHEIDFCQEDADAFLAWWEQITGQTRIQAPPSLKLT